MRVELTAMQKKLLAVGLLIGLIGVLYGLIARPLLDRYWENRELITVLEGRLSDYLRTAESGAALKKRLGQSRQELGRANYFLQSEKHALASAELQELIRNMIAASGGTLISSQSNDLLGAEGPEMVSIDARLRGDINALQNVLHKLANNRPIVFVDELLITSMRGRVVGRVNRGVPQKNNMLDIRIKISAYLRTGSGEVAL